MGKLQVDSAAELQRNVRNNTTDMQESIMDLFAWEKEMKAKEISLKTSKTETGSTTAPPGRAAGCEPQCRASCDPDAPVPPRAGSAPCNDQATTPGPKKTAAAHTYDYFKERWDKFDVDAAIAEVDAEPCAKGVQHREESLATVAAPIRRPHPPAQEAEFWKQKGNDYFKFGDFSKAKECYTTSLKSLATVAGYANRALTSLKLKEWKCAEADCTAALALDSTNLKIWQRRATAHRSEGNMLAYLKDLDSALRVAPESSKISSELQHALEDFLASQGLQMPRANRFVAVDRDANPAACEAPSDPRPVALELTSHGTVDKRDEQHAEEEIPLHQGSLEAAERSTKALATDMSTSSAIEQTALHRVPQNTTHSALAAVSVPTVALASQTAPANSADFETTWRGLKGCRQKQAALLSLIKPSQLPSMFGSAMTPGLLESVVRSALHSILEQRDIDHHVSVLEHLTRVDRFQLNLMLINKRAKEDLANVWRRCEACADLEQWEPVLRATRGKFNL